MTFDKITGDDLGILMHTPDCDLAMWWCQMNRFKWPLALPNPEPPHYVAGGRAGQLMNWIEQTIGKRQISREWNHKMSTAEFNDFWRATYCNDDKCRLRYEKRLSELDDL
jgi:hypothetical protein